MSQSQSKSRFEVGIARDRKTRNAIFRMRYRVYVKDMGKYHDFADHHGRMLSDSLDETATLLYMKAGSRLVATLRLNFGADGIPDTLRRNYSTRMFEDYPDSCFSFSSRLIVAPRYRNTTVLARLLNKAYEIVRQRECRFDFCHCAPSLVQLYENLGYRRYRDNFTDDDTGYRVPLVLILEGVEYLRAVRSPFYRHALKYDNPPDTSAWFAEKFPSRFGLVNERLMTTEDFWTFLASRLHEKDIPLFRGLDSSQSRRFASACTILKAKPGDRIVRKGDAGEEMFVVLSGAAEAFGRIGKRKKSLAIFGKGDVFGEMGLISKTERTADVVALTDLEVLVLNQVLIRKGMKSIPEIMAVVLMNLSNTLCERLRTTTTTFMELLGRDTVDTEEFEPPKPRTPGSYVFEELPEGSTELTRLKRQAGAAPDMEKAVWADIGIVSGKDILDIGCGPGLISRELARTVHPGKVTAIDTSEELIAYASERIADTVDNLAFQVADAYSLPFPRHSFDTTYARFLFQHLSDPMNAIRETFRVLKPGGTFCAADIDDEWLTVYPAPASFDAFTTTAAETQSARGGDRQIGRKLGFFLHEAGFENITTDVITLTTEHLGRRSFLDIVTGFKFAQMSDQHRRSAAVQREKIYAMIDSPYMWGGVGVFIVSARRP